MKLKIKKTLSLRKVLIFVPVAFFAAAFLWNAPDAKAASCGDHFGGTNYETGGSEVPCACGDTINSNYTMDNDLDCSAPGAPNIALTVGSKGESTGPAPSHYLTIDCQGHYIKGKIDALGNPVFSTRGISMNTYQSGLSGCKNVGGEWRDCQYIVIKNCRIESFDTGVFLSQDSDYVQVVNNDFYNNVIGISGDFTTPAQNGSGMTIVDNDILELNTKVDRDSYGILLKNFSAGVASNLATVRNNRITAYGNSNGKSRYGLYMRWEGTEVLNNGNKIENNFIKVYDSGGASNIYDLFIDMRSNFNDSDAFIYNNVFSGLWSTVNDAFGQDIFWYPQGQPSSVTNIFTQTGYTASPEALASKKACLDHTVHNLTKQSIVIDENTCLSSDYQFANAVSMYAVKINQDNVMLDCEPGVLGGTTINGYQSGDVANEKYGIYIEGKNRTTVSGCSVQGFKEGIRLENARDVLLRGNNIFLSTSPDLKIKDFYLNVVSNVNGSFGGLDYYDHQILNPALDLANNPVSLSWNTINRGATGKLILYYYWRDGLTRTVDYSVNDGSGNIYKAGHLTVASSTDITVANITINGGDPFIFAGIQATTNKTSPISCISASCSLIYSNNSFNNFIGFRFIESKNIDFFKNTATSSKPVSYGLFISGLSKSRIGPDSPSVNNNYFYYNNTGLYYEGLYSGNAPYTPEENIFQYNGFSHNRSFGAVVTKAYANKFLNNSTTDNGTDDDKVDPTRTDAECGDGTDNDGDGLLDSNEPDCLGGGPLDYQEYDLRESYSPGFYLNQALNNVFDGNTFGAFGAGNSADGLYIDSTDMISPETGKCTNAPLPTKENIFLRNHFDYNKHGSGVFITTDSCFDIDPDYNTTGKVEQNFFGYFYLENSSRANYATTPGNILAPIEDFGSSIVYNPRTYEGNPPRSGSNFMNNNNQDGITLYWRSDPDPSITKAEKVLDNDFYKNTIQNNERYGFYSYGNEGYKKYMFANDVIDNTIEKNSLGGVYLYASLRSRVFANDINANMADSPPTGFGFGVRVEFSPDDSVNNYNEIGSSLSCAPCGSLPPSGLVYGNIISKTGDNKKNAIGVLLYGLTSVYGDQQTLVEGNDINNYTYYGIKGYNANKSKIADNIISQGGSQSVGLAIVRSSDWDVNGNIITNISPPGRYMYVGPEVNLFPGTEYTINYFPYPWSDGLGNYYHKIYFRPDLGTLYNNLAGPTGDLKTILYYYGADNNSFFPGLDSYHVQIAWSKSFSITAGTLDSADPLEIDYYPEVFTATPTEFSNITLQNCRGDCMVLYNIFKNTNPLYPDELVNFENITINSAKYSGIKGFYVKGALFDTLNISGVNSDNYSENGGLYLYNSEGNTIKSSTFNYAPNPVGYSLSKRQWELFLAGKDSPLAEANTIISNTFSGSGAYELKSQLQTADIFTLDSTPSDPLYTELQSNYMCYVKQDDDGNEVSDALCDPNCMNEQDNTCRTMTNGQGTTGCTLYGVPADCCLGGATSLQDTEDCIRSTIDNVLTGLEYFCTVADDGCCKYNPSGGRDGTTCDPNCTALFDTNCNTFYPGGCGSDGSNCCNPVPDNTCDSDCPLGQDPDCEVQANNWCIDPSDFTMQNTFSMGAQFQLPNYYENRVAPAVLGGGGIPNGAYFCYAPRMKFDSITQGDWNLVSDGYRKLSLTDRNAYKYKFAVNMRFADLKGLGLRSDIKTSGAANGTFLGRADFFSLASNPITASILPNPPAEAIPGISTTASDYRLGKNSEYIITQAMDSYPAGLSLWADNTKYDAVQKVIWYSVYNGAGGWPRTNDSETRFARLEAINRVANKGKTYQIPDAPFAGDLDLSFTYDLKNPVADWSQNEQVDINIATYPHVYKLRWLPVTETNWTNAQAHYEIWFGETKSEVSGRYGSSKIWDDLTYSARSGSLLPYQNTLSCPGAEINCYDPDLADRNCNGLVSGKCESIVKVYPTGGLTGSPAPPHTFRQNESGYSGALDTYVWQKNPTTNYGAVTPLVADYMEGSTANTERYALMYWDVSPVPSNCVVTAADMTLEVTTASGSVFGAFQVTGSWNESTTWNTRPSQNSVRLIDSPHFPNPVSTGTKVVPFNSVGKNVIQSWIDNSANNKGIAIKADDASDTLGVQWVSKEGATTSQHPKLSITCAQTGGDGSYGTIYFSICAVDNFGNTECSLVSDVKPWVQTQYGDIYSNISSGEAVGLPSGADLSMSRQFGTFLIRSAGGNINSNWASLCDPANLIIDPGNATIPPGLDIQKCTQTGTDAIDFPDKSNNKYTIASLASLDFLNHANFVGASNSTVSDLQSRYGAHKVVNMNPATLTTQNLGGKIYYYESGSMTMNNPVVFNRAAGQSGSGLIIVKGNLIINQNVTYDDIGSVSVSLKEMPSATWIVLGDLTIGNLVTDLAGTFIVLGNPTATCTSASDLYCGINYYPAGCGIIDTGTKGNECGDGIKDSKLTIRGSLFARQFQFKRNLASSSEGSEVIIYDGRLQANPPLGLEDFAKNLPVWK